MCSRYVHLCQREKKIQSNIFQNIAECLRYVHLCQQEKQFSVKYFSNYRCVQDMFLCVKKKNNLVKYFSKCHYVFKICSFVSTRKKNSVKYFSKYCHLFKMFICVKKKNSFQSNIFQNNMCSRYVYLCQQENNYQSSISQNIALFIYANTKKKIISQTVKELNISQNIAMCSRYVHL